MRECLGLIRSETTGMPECPRDANMAPPEWSTWDLTCESCRANQERWAELNGDADRDEPRGRVPR